MPNNTKKLSLLNWNINQRAGKSKFIPSLVLEEIKKFNPDILVLTEFYKTTNYIEFISELENNGYTVNFSDGPKKSNQILIAFRKTLAVETNSFHCISSTTDELTPDFFHITINNLNIIGTRIKINTRSNNQEDVNQDFRERQLQVKTLINYANSLTEDIIILGDFNNGMSHEGDSVDSYSGLAREFYNYPMLSKMFIDNGYLVHTPDNSFSWKDIWNNGYKLDHMFTNGFNPEHVSNLHYDWDFIYREDYKTKVGYPDHAILKAELLI